MHITARRIGDELGPDTILLIRAPQVELEAIVVVDNVACGPAIGGVRMARDVTLEEVVRLARAMTLKNAAAGLAHGGGKAGIIADPAAPPERKEVLIRAFARAIRGLGEYIPGPDMGTDEGCMAWVKDEIGRAVGLPRVLGGLPLDEIGATGLGLAVAAEEAAPEAKLGSTGHGSRSRASAPWVSTPRASSPSGAPGSSPPRTARVGSTIPTAWTWTPSSPTSGPAGH